MTKPGKTKKSQTAKPGNTCKMQKKLPARACRNGPQKPFAGIQRFDGAFFSPTNR
jgi:hypothetical protein